METCGTGSQTVGIMKWDVPKNKYVLWCDIPFCVSNNTSSFEISLVHISNSLETRLPQIITGSNYGWNPDY